EILIGSARPPSRNVTRWRSGDISAAGPRWVCCRPRSTSDGSGAIVICRCLSAHCEQTFRSLTQLRRLRRNANCRCCRQIQRRSGHHRALLAPPLHRLSPSIIVPSIIIIWPSFICIRFPPSTIDPSIITFAPLDILMLVCMGPTALPSFIIPPLIITPSVSPTIGTSPAAAGAGVGVCVAVAAGVGVPVGVGVGAVDDEDPPQALSTTARAIIRATVLYSFIRVPP